MAGWPFPEHPAVVVGCESKRGVGRAAHVLLNVEVTAESGQLSLQVLGQGRFIETVCLQHRDQYGLVFFHYVFLRVSCCHGVDADFATLQ